MQCKEGFAQDGQSVLSRYMDAVSNGDPKKWQKIQSAHIESTSSYNSALADGTIPSFLDSKVSSFKVYRIWPDLYRAELWADSVLEMTVYGNDRKKFLVTGGGPPITLGDSPYDDKFEFMPVTIAKAVQKAKSIVLKGIVELEGIKCYEVEIVTKQLSWRLYFDEKTFLLNFWSNSTDGNYVTLTKVFNYKDINGLKFSLSETKSKDGIVFFWSVINLLELDIDIDRKIFEYPSK